MANDDINNLGGELSKATGMLQGFEQALTQVMGTFANFGNKGVETMKNVGEAGKAGYTSLSQSVENANKSILGMNVSLTNIGDKMLDVSSLFSNSDIFNTFAANAKGSLLTVSDAMEALGKQGGLLSKALHEIPGSNIMIGIVEKLGAAASQGQLAEAGFYAMTNAAGQLTEAWGEGGDQIASLGTRTADYMKKLDLLAVQNRTTIDATLGLSKAMSEVSPGDMDGIVHVGEGVGDQMDKITAVMRTAIGAGRDQKDVLDAISNAYANLGNAQGGTVETNQRGINLFSTMVELQQSLKIRFDDSKKALEEVASEFRNVGDETDSAAKIFDTFGRALQNTGISAKASVDIVSSMIDGISKLNIGTKAFLSSQAGGPGGLQGGLQIDEMLRKHDLAGVMNIAQNALKKQMGGRIYTQEEGAQSQEAASAYTRQKMLLQSGAFGIGKGADDQTAGRILEALKQGDISGLKDTMKTGQEKAGDLVEAGNAIQVRNETLLTTAVQFLQRDAIANELGAAAQLRNLAGHGQPLSEVANQLHSQYDQATSELSMHETPVSNMGKRAEDSGSQGRSFAKLKGNGLDGAQKAIGSMISSLQKAGWGPPSAEETAATTSAPILPMNSVSETRKNEILKHAQTTSHTMAMEKQAQATKEAVSKPTDKDNNIKVMIEVDNKDKGSNVNVSSTAPFSVKQHNGGLNPAPNMPAGH